MPSKARILLVDDDKAIVRVCQLRVRAAGYEAEVACDGRSAIAAALGRPPDAIVLDIRMPGMDGFEVLSALRDHDSTSAIPVIMLSANVAERAKTQALALGARLFISKPHRGQELLEALDAVLGQDRDLGQLGTG